MAYDDYDEEFEYTDSFKPDSSFVEEVYYDVDEHELLVFLDSGHGYLYKRVPASVYHDFSLGEPGNWLNPKRSVGRFYNSKVKKTYGPATEVAWDTEPLRKPDPAPAMTSVGAPVQVSLTATTDSQSWHLPQVTFDLAPKTPVVEEPETIYKHTVSYVVGNTEYSTTVEAGEGVLDGVKVVRERLEALGLPATVKGVSLQINE